MKHLYNYSINTNNNQMIILIDILRHLKFIQNS